LYFLGGFKSQKRNARAGGGKNMQKKLKKVKKTFKKSVDGV